MTDLERIAAAMGVTPAELLRCDLDRLRSELVVDWAMLALAYEAPGLVQEIHLELARRRVPWLEALLKVAAAIETLPEMHRCCHCLELVQVPGGSLRDTDLVICEACQKRSREEGRT